MTGATLFSGFGGADLGMKAAGIDVLWGIEIDDAIAGVARANGLHVTTQDVTEADPAEYERVDFIHASPVCFPSGVTVMTKRGFVDVSEVVIGDEVMTHRARWRKVTNTGSRVADTVILKGLGHYGIEVTPDHPFLRTDIVRTYPPHKERGPGNYVNTHMAEPDWCHAAGMAGHHWMALSEYATSTPAPIEYSHHEALRGQRFDLDDPAFWRVVGMWVGDGWTRYKDGKGNRRCRGTVSICAKHEEAHVVEAALGMACVRFRSTIRRTVVEFVMNSRPLSRWLRDNFGSGAANKRLPAWLLGLRDDVRQSFFAGYIIFADGHEHHPPTYNEPVCQSVTVSHRLAVGMRMLGLSLGYSASLTRFKRPKTCVIEGRTVNQRDSLILRFSRSERHSCRVTYNGVGFRSGCVRKVIPGRRGVTVHDITVDEDHSFIADGIVVHNCKSFSVAKAGREELEIDRKAAEATARFVRELRPRIFTLENVWGYRQSESWAIIYRQLVRSGYSVGFAKLSAADYGVPQTRERMIVWAVLDGVAPPAPTPTHAENPPAAGLFGDVLPRWIGWYAAIEDLLPSLPDSQLAPWQLKRLPEELRTLLVGAGGFDGNVIQSGADDPAFTVTANHNQDTVRGVLVDGDNAGKEGPIHRQAPTPSPSVSQSTKPSAVLVMTGNTSDVQAPSDSPALAATPETGGRVRAVLVEQNANDSSGSAIEKEAASPAGTVRTGTNHAAKAILVDGKLGSYGENMTVRPAPAPAPAVTTSHNNRDLKAAVGVRTVRMTPRCLARFQSFPDWYELPKSNRLACTGIGNAVPPLLMQRVAEHLVAQAGLRRAA